jgi:hypothetical protein
MVVMTAIWSISAARAASEIQNNDGGDRKSGFAGKVSAGNRPKLTGFPFWGAGLLFGKELGTPPLRSLRIIHLAENSKVALELQQLAGKILSARHLVPGSRKTAQGYTTENEVSTRQKSISRRQKVLELPDLGNLQEQGLGSGD